MEHSLGIDAKSRWAQSQERLVLVLDGRDMDVMEYAGPGGVLCDDVVAGANVLLGLTAVFSPSADAVEVVPVLTRPVAFHVRISPL